MTDIHLSFCRPAFSGLFPFGPCLAETWAKLIIISLHLPALLCEQVRRVCDRDASTHRNGDDRLLSYAS